MDGYLNTSNEVKGEPGAYAFLEEIYPGQDVFFSWPFTCSTATAAADAQCFVTCAGLILYDMESRTYHYYT